MLQGAWNDGTATTPWAANYTKHRNWTAARVGIPAIVECAKLSNSTGFQIDWEPRSYEQRWPLDFQLEQAREYAVFANEVSVCDSAIPQTGILALFLLPQS